MELSLENCKRYSDVSLFSLPYETSIVNCDIRVFMLCYRVHVNVSLNDLACSTYPRIMLFRFSFHDPRMLCKLSFCHMIRSSQFVYAEAN